MLLLSWVPSSAPAKSNQTKIPCRVFAVEDISSARHRRARIFVSTRSFDPNQAVALGYAQALDAVEKRGLAFVTVLVTRQLDGFNRDDHSAGTALAEINFNPGSTSVSKTRLEGKVVTMPITDRGELAVLLAPKRKLFNAEIVSMWLDAREEGLQFSCVRP